MTRPLRLPLFIVCLLSTAGFFQHELLAQTPVKKKQTPEKFKVKFETTKGDFVVEVTRKWSPLGADHFCKAVRAGFYNDCAFFRVIPGFVAQFGINGDPKVQKKWRDTTIKDDPVVESNKRGTISFAKTGRPNSRTTQLFINYTDNSQLNEYGFSPFGKVVEGMQVVDSIYSGYREQPDQQRIQSAGNAYLKKEFPKLDYIKKATVLKPDR